MLQARVAAALKIGALIVKIVVLLQRTLRMTPDAGMKHQHHSGLLTEKMFKASWRSSKSLTSKDCLALWLLQRADSG